MIQKAMTVGWEEKEENRGTETFAANGNTIGEDLKLRPATTHTIRSDGAVAVNHTVTRIIHMW